MAAYKITKKDYSLFRKECRYWLRYFGLKDWEVFFTNEESKKNRATCYRNYTGRICTLSLATEWDEIPVKYEVERTAFHEVCELLLSQLNVLCKNYYSVQVVDEYTHEIIRRLENSVFKQKRMK